MMLRRRTHVSRECTCSQYIIEMRAITSEMMFLSTQYENETMSGL